MDTDLSDIGIDLVKRRHFLQVAGTGAAGLMLSGGYTSHAQAPSIAAPGKFREEGFVDYEAFGAKGNGVADDLQAIVDAHAYANAHNLPVRSRPGAGYHLGYRKLTATISTDTDWNTSRFIIDDSDLDKLESHKHALFEVRSQLPPVELDLPPLSRDLTKIDVHPEQDCYVRVRSKGKRIYVRRGLNPTKGTLPGDCFILRTDGSIEGPIDWEHNEYDYIRAHAIDDHRLTVRGGVFETFANRMHRERGSSYWSRGIRVRRSNTEVVGVTHYVVGETDVGNPYSGFYSAGGCANVTFRDCFATGHKTYRTIGRANRPVSQGTYDFNANGVVNFSMIGCTQNGILDRTRWGIIGTNHCKNILLEDCRLSRMDTHMGVSGGYTIRRTTLGHAGLNAIGRGKLIVEDSTLYGGSLIGLRGDYGSTWEGEVVIRNSRWIPRAGRQTTPRMIGLRNDGMHDFGYPCYMPEKITIDGLFVDDSNHPEDYEGMYFLSNPDGRGALPAKRPYPYRHTRKIVVKDLTIASGLPPKVCSNDKVSESVTVEQG